MIKSRIGFEQDSREARVSAFSVALPGIAGVRLTWVRALATTRRRNQRVLIEKLMFAVLDFRTHAARTRTRSTARNRMTSYTTNSTIMPRYNSPEHYDAVVDNVLSDLGISRLRGDHRRHQGPMRPPSHSGPVIALAMTFFSLPLLLSGLRRLPVSRGRRGL